MAKQGVKNVCIQSSDVDHKLLKAIASEAGMTQGEILHTFLLLANLVEWPNPPDMTRIERFVMAIKLHGGFAEEWDACLWAIVNSIGTPKQRVEALLYENSPELQALPKAA